MRKGSWRRKGAATERNWEGQKERRKQKKEKRIEKGREYPTRASPALIHGSVPRMCPQLLNRGCATDHARDRILFWHRAIQLISPVYTDDHFV